MSHNSNGSSDMEPEGAQQPPSDGAPSGDGSNATPAQVGQAAGSVSELSDILAVTDELDKLYAGFDPAIHAKGPDGQPLLRKGGGFQLKRGRRAANPQATAPASDGTAVQASPAGAPTAPPKISNKEAATLLCQLTCGGLIAVFGDEWEPSDSEVKGLHRATLGYLEATGGMDMSPGVGLMFAWSGYAVPRATKPKTMEKLRDFGRWCLGLFRRRAE